MSSPAPSNNTKYYSAHRGPVFGADGKFDHFARQCDPIHLQNGYWKFSTNDDDRRAFLRGMSGPEDVLKAQDAGDSDYDDIMLRWVPGELDESNKLLVGTAAAHLQTICNERKLLGKTLSFRGAVPLYPLCTDPRLFQYRVARYGIQKGLLPNNLLAPTSPPPGISTSQTKSPRTALLVTSTPISSHSHLTRRSSPTVVTPARRPSSPSIQSETARPSCLEPAAAVPSSDHAQVRSSPFVADREHVGTNARSGSVEQLQTSLVTKQHYRNSSPLDPQVIHEDVASTPAVDLTDNPAMYRSEERSLDENDDKDDSEVCYTHDNDVAADDATDNVGHLSLAASTHADLFRAQMAALPCIDCGCLGAHASDCWINEATLSLKPGDELTTAELKRLADDVERFDPGPWATHYGPQQELVEDIGTHFKGIAEAIRNLDTTADDLELQGLEDRFTVLLWAFKSVGKVQVLESYSEQTDFEMLDM
ncbi:uncharacterized protein M421DRAFT_1008 [Didymella exigua CBS 183.55]|uniref:Uncharacterized protein n=1 Tax=Didymella exigua CBS 183.55 TaxID=1150837 RepID=A0A6A5S2H3_9PLEO|nr:uncharacterized protein M421DRAFT_1008 [Didymella exigua CBS 183.55]KAF1933624.1 hypothetical protein M421DRAFT_1008 [Didymella exigua CBS 183.55]